MGLPFSGRTLPPISVIHRYVLIEGGIAHHELADGSDLNRRGTGIRLAKGPGLDCEVYS